eukprot:6248758-Karenia_brevis.AAC.1
MLLARLGAQVAAASPPCQPWTTVGHQQGYNDERGIAMATTPIMASVCGWQIVFIEQVAAFTK